MKWEKDRVHGATIGHAWGDAAGAPFEFYRSKRKLIYHDKIEYEPEIPSRWLGWRQGVVGQVTDDSEMTRVLLNHLKVTSGHYERDRMILGYEQWSNSKPVGQGKNTAALFRGISTVAGFEKRRARIQSGESNGSLMRCWPLALIADESDMRAAINQDCDLTNPNEVNRNASQVYVAAVRAALQGKTKQDIRRIVLEEATQDKVRRTVENALRPKEAELVPLPDCDVQPWQVDGKHKGWVLVALYVTLRYFFTLDTYSCIVNEIIRRGGDTDTNAAIAGALAGAHSGLHIMMCHPHIISHSKEIFILKHGSIVARVGMCFACAILDIACLSLLCPLLILLLLLLYGTRLFMLQYNKLNDGSGLFGLHFGWLNLLCEYRHIDTLSQLCQPLTKVN